MCLKSLSYFVLSIYGTITQADDVLNHKETFQKSQRAEIRKVTLSEDNAVKLEIKNDLEQ